MRGIAALVASTLQLILLIVLVTNMRLGNQPEPQDFAAIAVLQGGAIVAAILAVAFRPSDR